MKNIYNKRRTVFMPIVLSCAILIPLTPAAASVGEFFCNELGYGDTILFQSNCASETEPVFGLSDLIVAMAGRAIISLAGIPHLLTTPLRSSLNSVVPR